MKRFIECSGYVQLCKRKFDSLTAVRVDFWRAYKIYIDIKSIDCFGFFPEIAGEPVLVGWFIVKDNYYYKIKNQEDVDMLINMESDNIGNDIRHLTEELSYNPGRIGAGSEFLQAVKRQADNYNL